MTEIHPFQGLVREELHPELEALRFVRMDFISDQNIFNSYSYKILRTDFSSDNWNQFWNGHFLLSSGRERGESGITEGWGVMKGQAVASAQQWQILHYTTHSNYSNMILRHEYEIQQQHNV